MKSRSKALIAGIAAIGVIASLAACSTPAAGDGKVTITVVSLIPGSDQSAFDAFDAQVAQFEKANPNITVKSQEYEWTGPTFAAQLAGGTLPDVFTIPFTDGKTLIENGQLADITDLVNGLDYSSKFNPNVLSQAQGTDGKIYGLPTAAYGNGLQYNRAIFTAAGLDPDKPPTTWAEVRADAKIIADKTGLTGFAQMAASNTGGWQLAVGSATRGGRLEVKNGDSVTVTADNAGTKATLEYLKALRWEDNSMGANFLLDWGTINQAFGAGQIGMYTSGSDIFTNLVQSQAMDPANYGLASLPLEGKDAGVLAGGTIATVNIKATDAVKAAAVKWIDFYYMQKLLNKDAAILDAKTLSEANQPVGVPALPIFDKATLTQSQEWIKDYINVPQNQVSFFLDNIFDQPTVAEPISHTQELYAALDVVVQSVLTDPNADIDALLKQVNTDVQALVDAG
ncbi:MAG: sugar transporter substrate-binding protein [Rhodoglobus sp.]|nr:sugar transporter substrate-binding protein [Rhodoglobus sp.]